VPSAATGVAPSGQPIALTTFTTGISDLLGGGSSGSGPVVAETGSREEAQPERPIARTARTMMLFFALSIGNLK
jgi:hypothetical protein